MLPEAHHGGAAAPPILAIRGLRKTFGRTEVLAGIDLDVARGEFVAVIGPSGSGKSTLLRSINRLEEPSAGEITLDGVHVTGRGVNLNRIRRDIGMVFQSFNLYPHLTARGNVMLALRKVLRMSRSEATATAMKALDRVGLAHKAHAYPAELSGGQQQRVAIARSMALGPKLFLFDEPTSALDPELIAEVLQVMHEMRANRQTMIVVTHEMDFARRAADRVIFMDHGTIVAQGPPAHIFGGADAPRLKDFLRNFHRRDA